MAPETASRVALLMRAFSELRPRDDRTRLAVAQILGFTLAAVPRARDEPTLPRYQNAPDHRAEAIAPLTSVTPYEAEPVVDETSAVIPSRLSISKLGREHRGSTQYLPENVRALPRGGRTASLDQVPSLLEPTWQRNIVVAAMSSSVEANELDTDRATEDMAQGQELRRLPKRRRDSLQVGSQLLVDAGPTMAPFSADRRALARIVRDAVGEGTTYVGVFRGTPLGGVGQNLHEPLKAYSPPAGGVVLLLSGLGAAAASSSSPLLDDEWLEFAERVRQKGRAPVVLSPYPIRDVSRRLRSAFTILMWSRSTTARDVRYFIGRSRRGSQ